MTPRHYRAQERKSHDRFVGTQVVCGFLDEDLEAASDPLTGATTALMTTVEWESNGADPDVDPANWYETGEQVRVVNRTQRTAGTDYWCVALLVNSEFLVIDTSCDVERP